jgi:hypothetical protein
MMASGLKGIPQVGKYTPKYEFIRAHKPVKMLKDSGPSLSRKSQT